MFSLIKQVFIVLLSFRKHLATKCMSLINGPCMIRYILNGLNRVELTYCPFMISVDECSESCNSVDDLSTKICS